MIATLAGCALAWGGLVLACCTPTGAGWFVGFFTAGVLYVAMMRGTRRTARAAESARPSLAG